MIAIFNETPRYCPSCGRDHKWDNLSRQDFFAGASQTCPRCGLHFAYLAGDKILEAAAQGGDIGRYVTAADL